MTQNVTQLPQKLRRSSDVRRRSIRSVWRSPAIKKKTKREMKSGVVQRLGYLTFDSFFESARLDAKNAARFSTKQDKIVFLFFFPDERYAIKGKDFCRSVKMGNVL